MTLHLFEGYGVELEYMIVDCERLNVYPAADQVLKAIAGEFVSDVEMDGISWSNELVLHVVELKTNGPAKSLGGLESQFQENVARINEILGTLGGRLMPAAMHPWMDPMRETRLWPHEYNPVYETFNRIFDCRGHGWSNLQSTHLNLPFCGDAEFGRLHAAIRLVLPILPALSASSPIVEGRRTGLLDSRLEAYRGNARRIPSVSGHVIPEAVFSKRAYRKKILERIYADLAPHDPEGILRDEWANARGAIARFQRNTIEIRVLDVQECPAADLAILRMASAVIRALIEGRWADQRRQRGAKVEALEEIFLAVVRDADGAVIKNPEYLGLFGRGGAQSENGCTAGELWRGLAEELIPEALGNAPCSSGGNCAGELAPLRVILEQGPLARRILRAIGPEDSLEKIRAVYGQLCECLAEGKMFRAV